jgi:membrane fusion protein (multidrug efflux system)
MSNQNTTQTTAASSASQPATRRKSLMILGGIVVICGILYTGYEWIVASHYESTDNAYVQGNIIQITPQTSGTVHTILADDTDYVAAGQTLVKLDPADAQIALAQAEANLAQAVRQVRTLYVNNGSLSAQITLRQAEVTRAESQFAQTQDDFKRRETLVGNGAVSKEELQHAKSQADAARSALAASQAALTAARESLSSNQSLTEGITVDQHPNVLAAAAKVREAYLASQRTELLSPVDGYVAKRTVQLGQRVAAGTPLLTVVPLQQIWVDANLKENQLRNLRIGQTATLTADLYGSKTEYHGKVVGLGIGTGAAFALLPAQNATGNWIKVVQRVPVRIALDDKELADKPLRVGLSMDVKIDIRNQDGPVLANAPRSNAVNQTQIYDKQMQDADADVARIITANAGAGYKPTAVAKAAPATTSVH